MVDEQNNVNIGRNKIDNSHEIDLIDALRSLWKGKIWLILSMMIGLVASVVISASLPNVYRAEVLVASASAENRSVLSGITSQLSGLANLAGINVDEGTNDLVLVLEILKSRAFLTNFMDVHGLLVPILSGINWDKKEESWVYDENIFDSEKGGWVAGYKPSQWHAYNQFLEDNLSISLSNETGLVTIAVKSYSPEHAHLWANQLVQDINDHMRENKIEESKRSIEFLKSQLANIVLADMQKVFYQLIEQQTKTMMLAEVRKGYALKVIDPAIVPEEPVSPNRVLIVILGVGLGGMIGILIAFFMGYRRPLEKHRFG